jgi:hypothetical protein
LSLVDNVGKLDEPTPRRLSSRTDRRRDNAVHRRRVVAVVIEVLHHPRHKRALQLVDIDTRLDTGSREVSHLRRDVAAPLFTV